MRENGLSIAPDARAALTALIGGDRGTTRSELRKLALYAHGKPGIGLDDVLAVVADATELKLDEVVDAAFAGKLQDIETHFAKARSDGGRARARSSALRSGRPRLSTACVSPWTRDARSATW